MNMSLSNRRVETLSVATGDLYILGETLMQYNDVVSLLILWHITMLDFKNCELN